MNELCIVHSTAIATSGLACSVTVDFKEVAGLARILHKLLVVLCTVATFVLFIDE